MRMKTCYFVGNQFWSFVRSVLASFACRLYTAINSFSLDAFASHRAICLRSFFRLPRLPAVTLCTSHYILLFISTFLLCADYWMPSLRQMRYTDCRMYIRSPPISRNVFSIAHIIYYRVRMCVFAFAVWPRVPP